MHKKNYSCALFHQVYRNDPRNLTSEIRSAVKYIKHSLFNETSLVADLCLIKVGKIHFLKIIFENYNFVL